MCFCQKIQVKGMHISSLRCVVREGSTRESPESFVLRASRREELRIAQAGVPTDRSSSVGWEDETLGKYSPQEFPPQRGGARDKQRERFNNRGSEPSIRLSEADSPLLASFPGFHPGLFSTAPYGSIPRCTVNAIVPEASI
jgi:hypothetical protein